MVVTKPHNAVGNVMWYPELKMNKQLNIKPQSYITRPPYVSMYVLSSATLLPTV